MIIYYKIEDKVRLRQGLRMRKRCISQGKIILSKVGIGDSTEIRAIILYTFDWGSINNTSCVPLCTTRCNSSPDPEVILSISDVVQIYFFKHFVSLKHFSKYIFRLHSDSLLGWRDNLLLNTLEMLKPWNLENLWTILQLL